MARSLREAFTRAITREPREVVQEVVQEATHKPLEAVMQQNKIASNVQTITPNLAKVWLTRNTHNRPMSVAVVKKYTKYMLEGQWRLNGEAIIFADDGSLMSGQHRLQACVNANKPFQSVVITGVDRSTFATLDTHKKRTAADVLGIEGVKNCSRVAATARAYVRVKYGIMAARNFTNEQYAEFVADHPSVVKWGSTKTKQTAMFKAYVFGVIAAIEDTYDAATAQQFYEKLVEGIGLHKNDPEMLLRNRMLVTNLMEEEGMALTIKAFNFRVAGKPVKQLKMMPQEEFPRIIGME